MSRTTWAFVPDGAGRFVFRVGPDEREVLLDVVDSVVDLLGGAPDDVAHVHPLDALRLATTPLPTPLDPALRRLLPDASTEDPALAAEFRRLTEADLRATKVAHLTALRGLLATDGPVTVGPEDAPAVAAALTDLRLVVSERLGIRTDDDAEAVYRAAFRPRWPGRRAPDDGAAALGTVYVALTMLQESLVEAMLRGLDGAPD